MHEATISALYRYPVKGLSPDQLNEVVLSTGQMFPLDRAYAVENGSRDFDPMNPRYFPKAKFLQLMSNEQLAALETCFDGETHTLQILRNGKKVSAGDLSQPIGRQLIEQFLSAYLGPAARGAPHIVSAQDHHFADVPDTFISLINLATVRDIARVVGRPVDPMRFRGNIYVDGWPAWHELELVGATLDMDDKPLFAVSELIGRCAATNVDPSTGARDMHIPRTLGDVFGHEKCGLYLTAIVDSKLSPGGRLTVGARQSANSADRSLGI